MKKSSKHWLFVKTKTLVFKLRIFLKKSPPLSVIGQSKRRKHI